MIGRIFHQMTFKDTSIETRSTLGSHLNQGIICISIILIEGIEIVLDLMSKPNDDHSLKEEAEWIFTCAWNINVATPNHTVPEAQSIALSLWNTCLKALDVYYVETLTNVHQKKTWYTNYVQNESNRISLFSIICLEVDMLPSFKDQQTKSLEITEKIMQLGIINTLSRNLEATTDQSVSVVDNTHISDIW